MSDVQIQGFTDLQRDIADRLWQLDSTEDIEHYISTLPRSLKREAWVVMNMIIAAELDQYMEISTDVKDYCRGL